MYSTMRDVVNTFAMVGGEFAGTPLKFQLTMEIVYKEEQDIAYQRWVLFETVNGYFHGKCFFGAKNDVIDALYDILDLNAEEEIKACNEGKGYVKRKFDDMMERVSNERKNKQYRK